MGIYLQIYRFRTAETILAEGSHVPKTTPLFDALPTREHGIYTAAACRALWYPPRAPIPPPRPLGRDTGTVFHSPSSPAASAPAPVFHPTRGPEAPPRLPPRVAPFNPTRPPRPIALPDIPPRWPSGPIVLPPRPTRPPLTTGVSEETTLVSASPAAPFSFTAQAAEALPATPAGPATLPCDSGPCSPCEMSLSHAEDWERTSLLRGERGVV